MVLPENVYPTINVSDKGKFMKNDMTEINKISFTIPHKLTEHFNMS